MASSMFLPRGLLHAMLCAMPRAAPGHTASDELRFQLSRALAPALRAAGLPRDARLESESISFEVVNPTTAGLLRVWSPGTTFSCVLKRLRAPAEPQAPSHWNYWRREALAYESGLLGSVPQFRPPKTLAVSDVGEELWIFMEEVRDAHRGKWSLAQHLDAARDLGRFNGHWATRRLPRQPWICRGWLRGVSEQRTVLASVVADWKLFRHPQCVRAFPVSVEVRLKHLLTSLDSYLDALDALPQTLCHFDAFRANLFRPRGAGAEGTVAIDWAFLGTGAVGVDLGQMLVGNAMWLHIPPRRLETFTEALFESYLAGVRDSGAQVDVNAIRLAFHLSVAVRVGLYLPFLLLLLTSRGATAEWARLFEGPMSRSVPEFGRAVQQLLGHAVRGLWLLDAQGAEDPFSSLLTESP